MSFLWPQALLLLLLLPLAVAAYVGLERRRRGRLAELGSLGMAVGSPGPDGRGDGRRRVRRWLAASLVLAGVTTLIVALGRPQAIVGLPRQEGIVVLGFDVSASMAADDMAPTRMEAAKAAASAFVRRQPEGVVIGVVAFSDSGLTVQVPTRDQAAVLAAIERLRPQRGTSLDQGVSVALQAILATEEDEVRGYYTSRSPEPLPSVEPVEAGSHGSAVVVLLTDGEATSDRDPLAGAETAAIMGVRVHTVGVGSARGTVLDVEWLRVHTQLDEATLRAIADLTRGTYQHADTAAELQHVYDTLDTRLAIRTEAMEVTALVTVLGLVLLLVGGVAGLVWLGRLP